MNDSLPADYFKWKNEEEIAATLLAGSKDKTTLLENVDLSFGSLDHRLKRGFRHGLYGRENTLPGDIYIYHRKLSETHRQHLLEETTVGGEVFDQCRRRSQSETHQTGPLSESYFCKKGIDEIVAVLLNGSADKGTLYDRVVANETTIRTRLKEGFADGLFTRPDTHETQILVREKRVPDERLPHLHHVREASSESIRRDNLAREKAGVPSRHTNFGTGTDGHTSTYYFVDDRTEVPMESSAQSNQPDGAHAGLAKMNNEDEDHDVTFSSS